MPDTLSLTVNIWPRLILAATLVLVLATTARAEPEIHRCPQADGTVAFQETPCEEPAVDAPPADAEPETQAAMSDDFFDFVNPFDEPVDEPAVQSVDETSARSEVALPPPVSQDRAECEKLTRDAIDAIDLEMRQGYSPEDGERYKAELMTLTRQLRACKQLE